VSDSDRLLPVVSTTMSTPRPPVASRTDWPQAGCAGS
jgi:hypothetical protein